MLIRLLLLFVVVPLVELALLLYLSDLTNWRITLALVIVTGLVGSWLARRQGVGVWVEIQQQLRQGQLPADSLFDGVLILVAGALLMTPGVLTDAFGFFLLVPPGRRVVKRRIADWFRQRVKVYRMGDEAPDGQRDQVIDVRVVDPDEDGKQKPQQ